MGSIGERMDVSIIPCNMERYLSMTINKVRFVDWYQFLSASLDNLAAIIPYDSIIHMKNYEQVQGNDYKLKLLL